MRLFFRLRLGKLFVQPLCLFAELEPGKLPQEKFFTGFLLFAGHGATLIFVCHTRPP